MKGLGLRVKNLLLVDRFYCFFMRDWSQRTPMLQDFLKFAFAVFEHFKNVVYWSQIVMISSHAVWVIPHGVWVAPRVVWVTPNGVWLTPMQGTTNEENQPDPNGKPIEIYFVHWLTISSSAFIGKKQTDNRGTKKNFSSLASLLG